MKPVRSSWSAERASRWLEARMQRPYPRGLLWIDADWLDYVMAFGVLLAAEQLFLGSGLLEDSLYAGLVLALHAVGVGEKRRRGEG